MTWLSLIFTLAWRYFRARREKGLVSIVTGFSIAGLAVGVATLVISMAVFTGFQLELRGRLYALEGSIKLQGLNGPYLNWDPAYARQAAQIENVSQVIPYLNAPSIVFRGNQAQGALFRGLDLAQLENLPFGTYLVDGGFQGYDLDASLAPALIGTILSQDLGLGLGDELRAYESGNFSLDTQTPTLPRALSFEIVGIFDSGLEEVDKSLILTTPEAVRTMANLSGDTVFEGAQVYLHDAIGADAARLALEQVFQGQPLRAQSSLSFDQIRDGGLGFSAATHLQLAKDQEAAMNVILSLIILVAAFGVIASQIMKVREKSREIAVLRSFGAGRGLILAVFLLLGLIIGLLGSFIGAGLGLIIALNLDALRLGLEGATGLNFFPADQFRLAFLPSRPTFGAIALSIFLSLFLTLLAMIYPAYRAARLSPGEALRYE